MKKKIFLVKKRKNYNCQKTESKRKNNINEQHRVDNCDEIYLPQPQPNQNNGNKKAKPHKIIFIAEKTNNETKDTLSYPSIWKKNPKSIDINQFDIIKYIKKEVINSFIIYINGLLGLFNIEDKLIPINDEISEIIDKSYNIRLLNTTLENILTGELYFKNGKKRKSQKNIILIKKIYDKNIIPIINIINKKFLEVLEHFRNTKYIPELQGFELYFCRIIEKLEYEGKNKEYIVNFINTLKDFEYIYGYKKIINLEIIKNEIEI